MLNPQELKNKSLDELKGVYHDLSKEIYELNTELSVARKLEKPHLLRDKKKDRARVLTIMNQKSQGKA